MYGKKKKHTVLWIGLAIVGVALLAVIVAGIAERPVENTDHSSTSVVEANDQSVELYNGLRIVLPDNWTGKYFVSDEDNYIHLCSIYEKSAWESDSVANGYLFGIYMIHSCNELNFYPERKLLGVYKEDDEWIGLLIDYPSDVEWDENSEESTNNYQELMNSMEQILFDTSKMNGFIACDEDSLTEYLPQDF